MRPVNRNDKRTWVKHHRRRNLGVLGSVSTLLVIIIVALASSPTPAIAQVGKEAPDFAIPTIANGGFHLHEHKGTPVLIEFMTTSCHFCTEQAPILSELWSRHGIHVDFISITIDPVRDQPSVLSAYAQQHNMPWTWAVDKAALSQTYGVKGTPTLFLLDEDCVIKNRFDGLTTLSILENGVLAIL